MKSILVTGATGQIGTELVDYLREIYGASNVIASGRRLKEGNSVVKEGPYELFDVTDPKRAGEIVENNKIDVIYHLASILSATGEKDPQALWEVNMNGLCNILEAARIRDCSVFFPSSIAVFGPQTPKDKTPQDSITRPSTIYGISKVTGELLGDYYHQKYGLDIRGLRYPGVISNIAMPGGGTTDFAVHIYYEAIKSGRYACFLKEDTRLDFIYMPDALKGAVDLMETDPEKLEHRNAFNVTAMSITPKELCEEIKKHIPEFTMEYEVDPVRQSIADSWPNSMDDASARSEWGWDPQYNLAAMTEDMLKILKERINATG
ncbi:MAG: NAD-dependent epimerase/dehydratase family protein [Bacillota bacterium]